MRKLFQMLFVGLVAVSCAKPVEESHDIAAMRKFFEQKDSLGITNAEKAGGSLDSVANIPGVVIDSATNKLIGLGIHIYNEDVYPIQSFKLYLRDKGLIGNLDLSGCHDMVFFELYRNQISSADLHDMPALRILGLQGNQLTSIDPSELQACQGIDVGKNKLKAIDVSKNVELVELYVNDNDMSKIDLSHNQKLKYFYCHNNHITTLDATQNPLLRHLNCTGNPMREIKALAPQREEQLPLTLIATEGGYVGMNFSPIYNDKWKETGEWQQIYYAYPQEGYAFAGWQENNKIVSKDTIWTDEYGAARELTAMFVKEK